MKLIIDIPDHLYNVIKNKECTITNVLTKAVDNGTPLDSVIAEIRAEIVALPKTYPFVNHIDTYVKEDDVLHILDNIGETNKRSKIRCNTCVNNDDELSGECYECLKGIFDHYETEVENGRTND